jgi:hypothetical protein
MTKEKRISLLFVLFSGAALAQASLPEFDEVDTNDDGTATQEEVDAALQGFDFSSADIDSNGTLSRDEYDMGIQQQTSGGN